MRLDGESGYAGATSTEMQRNAFAKVRSRRCLTVVQPVWMTGGYLCEQIVPTFISSARQGPKE